MITETNILVTGGGGFIGSHVCDELIRLGNTLTVIDDLSTGNIENLQGIVNDIDFYEEKIETFNLNSLKDIGAIIHLAAQTSVPLSIEEFKDSSNSNISGCLNIIDYSKEKGIPLVYASSSAVYGNLPIGDDSSMNTDLISPYAVDKYTMELYGKMANALYQLPNIGLRFFNVYGERQDPSSQYSGVISVFIDQMLNQQQVTIHGGHQTRDFIYVANIVESIIASLSLLKKRIIFENINVLTGVSTSINELFKILAQHIDYNISPKYTDLLLGDPIESGGTIAKLQSTLMLDPNVFKNLNEGLLRTIKSIDKN